MPKIQGSSTLDKVIDCINGHLEVSVYYEGDQQNVRGWRRVIIVSVGNHISSGNMVCRVYQYAGDSASQPLTPSGWRLFLVDKIKNFEYIRTYKKKDLSSINPPYRAEKLSNGAYKAKDAHIPKPMASATFNLSQANKEISNNLKFDRNDKYIKKDTRRGGVEYNDDVVKKHRRTGDYKTRAIEKFNSEMGRAYNNADAERLYFIYQKVIKQISTNQAGKYKLYKPEVDFVKKLQSQGVKSNVLQNSLNKIVSML